MIAREIDVKEVAAVTAKEQPDVALVGLGESSQHVLELISEIVPMLSPTIAPAAATATMTAMSGWWAAGA